MSSQELARILPMLCALALAAFFPAMALCYRLLRLPQKKEELRNLCKGLGLEDNLEACPYGLFKTYEETGIKDYVLPVLFCFIYSVIVLYVLFDPAIFAALTGNEQTQTCLLIYSFKSLSMGPLIQPPPLHWVDLGNVTAILMAALGCYVWSIQYLGRRLSVLDLTPGAFFAVATRMIFASFIALAVAHVLQTMNNGPDTTMLPAIAFVIGMFPQRGLTLLQEKMSPWFRRGQRTHELPLGMIEGINLFTKTRLAEVDVDNAQNLAEANLVELMLRTPFNPWKIMDWIAQAKLYVHVDECIEELRKQGVRTVFDFLAVTEPDAEGHSALQSCPSMPAESLRVLRQALENDPTVALLDRMRARLTRDYRKPTPQEKLLLADSV